MFFHTYKHCPCPIGFDRLDEKTKSIQWKQLKLTLVSTSHKCSITLKPKFFPLCFWFGHLQSVLPSLSSCGRPLEVTSMICLVNSHSSNSFRLEHPLHHYPFEGVITTFLHLGCVCVCLLLLLLLLFFTEVYFCPNFSPPRSSLNLHYLCLWQHSPILQPLSFLSLSMAAFALTPWGFILI